MSISSRNYRLPNLMNCNSFEECTFLNLSEFDMFSQTEQNANQSIVMTVILTLPCSLTEKKLSRIRKQRGKKHPIHDWFQFFFFYYLHCDFESMIEKCSAKFHRFESIMADSSQNQAQAKVRLMKKMNIIKSESSLYGALCISEQSTLNIYDKQKNRIFNLAKGKLSKCLVCQWFLFAQGIQREKKQISYQPARWKQICTQELILYTLFHSVKRCLVNFKCS